MYGKGDSEEAINKLVVIVIMFVGFWLVEIS